MPDSVLSATHSPCVLQNEVPPEICAKVDMLDLIKPGTCFRQFYEVNNTMHEFAELTGIKKLIRYQDGGVVDTIGRGVFFHGRQKCGGEASKTTMTMQWQLVFGANVARRDQDEW